MHYKGWQLWECKNDEELANFYNGKVEPPKLLENQYLLLADKGGEVVDTFVWQRGSLKVVKWEAVPNAHYGKVTPRNPEQQIAFHLMQDMMTPIKVLTLRSLSAQRNRPESRQ